MNAMHYDAATIGNHDFRYGLPYLDSAVAEANFPFLSDNIYRTDGAHAYHPWAMVTRAGVKVAIIGATTPGVTIWEPANIRGRVTLGDIVPAVRLSVMEAEAAGADVIVAVVHSGLDEPSNYDTVRTRVASENVAARIAAEIPAIDVVVYGHSHKEMREKIIGTTLLAQPKNFAASVSIVHVGVVHAGSRWAVSSKRADLVQTGRHVESPAILSATEPVHQKTVAYFNQPIGTTTFDWRADSSRLKDTPIIDFVLEVQRKASDAQLAATAVYNPAARIEPGSITRAQLANLYPFDNTVRTVRITGKQLRDYLEHSARFYTGRTNADGTLETDPAVAPGNFDIVSGVDYVIDLNKPAGSRITRLEYKGTPVSSTDSFTMALNNYRQGGAGGYSMLRGAPVVAEDETEIGDLLVAEAQKRGTLDPANYFIQNWTLVLPAPASQ